jgi:hypothetical protein
MSQTTHANDDAGDGLQIPQADTEPDRIRAARVKLLRHAIAQQILEIPADCSKHSRATRIGKVRQRVSGWWSRMSKTCRRTGGLTLCIDDEREWMTWCHTAAEAWNVVKAALDAGEPMTAFMFPSEDSADPA